MTLMLFMLFLRLETVRADDTNQVAQTNSPATNAPASANAAPSAMPPTNAAPAVDTTSSGNDRKSFDIISRMSIFNPNRSPRRTNAPTTYVRPRQTDSFTLVGTVSYDKGDFAIFDGSSSAYRKNVKVTEKIAGYTVAQVGHDSILLGASSNKTFRLPVGSQMRRTEGEKWVLRGSDEAIPELASDSSAPATPPATSAAAPAGKAPGGTVPTSEESDIVKRLMARRASGQ